MSFSTALKRGAFGVVAAAVVCSGAASASAGWTSTADGGASVASVNDARTKVSVRDASGDGNRAYADYWRNDSGSKYQLVTYGTGDVASATMSGSTRVASFRACNDHPLTGDTCASRQYI